MTPVMAIPLPEAGVESNGLSISLASVVSTDIMSSMRSSSSPVTDAMAQSSSSTPHISVLLEGAVDALVQAPTGNYLDGTFGRGGHSRAILKNLAPEGRLIGIDRDPEALKAGQAIDDARFTLVRSSFSELDDVARQQGVFGQLSGILLDIGVSSPQLDDAARGFSFLRDGPLDMRMDPEHGVSAAQWIADAEEHELARVFKEYGEERYARRLAKAIVQRRRERPFLRTVDLAEVVKAAHPAWEKHKHPATRVFQAIRIHINDELGQLDAALDAALEALAPGGLLVVISFHSLEDRRVKRFIRDKARGDIDIPKGLPLREDQLNRRLAPVGKALRPSKEEVDANPRARSAVMRVARKLA